MMMLMGKNRGKDEGVRECTRGCVAVYDAPLSAGEKWKKKWGGGGGTRLDRGGECKKLIERKSLKD